MNAITVRFVTVCFVVFAALLLHAGFCLAAPMPPTPTVTVVGTVVEAKWTPEETKKGRPGMSGSLGRDRTFPARFAARLKDAEVEIVKSTGNQRFDGPSGKVDSYRLIINSNDKDLLKPGMRIKVANYRIWGDEGFVGSKHDNVEILGQATQPAAKIAAPKPVAPVVHEGVKYVAPNAGGPKARVEAQDPKTGRKLWDVVVYEVKIDPSLEEDVQWVFITALGVRDNTLVVTNAKNEQYLVDLKTRKVEKVKKAVKEKR